MHKMKRMDNKRPSFFLEVKMKLYIDQKNNVVTMHEATNEMKCFEEFENSKPYNRRDQRVAIYTSHGAECARLRRVHAAQCNLLKKRGRRKPSFFLKYLCKRRGDDRHGVDLLGVAAAGEVVDRRVQAKQDLYASH